MKFSKFLYLTVLLFAFSACEDQLDLTPEQELPTEEALGDLPGLETALLGAYNGLQGVAYYGRNYLVMPEVEGDLAYLSIENSNRFVGNYLFQWTTENTDIRDFWNQAYSIIRRTNNILANIDAVEGDQERKDQIRGEALALRALVHFDLVRVFARPYTQSNPSTDLGVPVITEPLDKDAEPARNTIEEVYNQVIADLTAARDLLANEDIYRFTADAAEALLARVYLYKGDWANAEQSATAVINSGRYQLAADIVAAFQAPGSSEEIFTLRFVAAETAGADNLGQIYNPSGYGDIRVTTDLTDLYEQSDKRLGFIYEYDNGELYQSKFEGQEGVPGLFSPKILRLAEMYLIRAEARARQGNAAGALQDLNTLRAARMASALSGLSGDELLNAILAERRRELAFEGHTKFDLWRTGTDLERKQCNTGLELQAPCTIEADSPLTVYPIPQREIDVNQNMVQNPGYQ